MSWPAHVIVKPSKQTAGLALAGWAGLAFYLVLLPGNSPELRWRLPLVAFAAGGFLLLAWSPLLRRLVDTPTPAERFAPLWAGWLALPGMALLGRHSGQWKNALGIHKYVLLAIWAGVLMSAASVLIRRLWREPEAEVSRRQLWRVAVAALLVSLIAVPAIRLHEVHGDEPYYLWMTASILADFDLDLTNNVPASLHNRLVQYPGRHGAPDRHYSGYFPTYSLILLPGYLPAGATGAVLIQVLIATLLSVQVFSLMVACFGPGRVALWGWLVALGTAPGFTFATQLYPELLAALLVVIALRRLAGGQPAGTTALGLGMLPWLHPRYIYLAAVVGLLMVGREWRTRRTVRVPLAILLGLTTTAFAYRFFLTPPGLHGGESTFFPRLFFSQMVRFFLDQEYGLWFLSPLALLLPLAWVRGARAGITGDRRYLGPAALLLVAFCLFHGLFGFWGIGSVSGRYLAPLAPVLALLMAGLYARAGRRGRPLLTALLLLSILLALVQALAPVFRFERADGRNLLLALLPGQWTAYCPSLVRVGTHFSLPLDGLAWAWLILVLLLNGVGAWLVRSGPGHDDPVQTGEKHPPDRDLQTRRL